jgi:hypothetical protein
MTERLIGALVTAALGAGFWLSVLPKLHPAQNSPQAIPGRKSTFVGPWLPQGL